MMKINRRTFAKSLAAAAAASAIPSWASRLDAAARTPGTLARAAARLPANRVTRIRVFYPPNYNANGPQAFPQSNMVVLVDTEAGITGIGQGGSPDTVRNMARSVIGKNAFDTEYIWQHGFMDGFYSPGKERLHALGAIDLALWDIKGKALKMPVHEILGGTVRKHCECYGTTTVVPSGPGRTVTLADRAKAAMDAGFRAFRMGAGDMPIGQVYDTHAAVRRVIQQCREARQGVGPNGDWCIDFHQRFDYNDAVRACRGIEEFEPYFVEDPVRDEHALMDLPRLRQMTVVPLTHGEEWGNRWDFNRLVENHDVDYIRATLPNVGGITEMMKIAAMCETHAVGIVPHFTGPIATAALVNCLSTFPGPVMFEYNFGGQRIDYLPECLDFKDGKAYTNQRPGLGVTADMSKLKLIGEVTTPGRRNVYERPDGSLTHW